MKKIVALFGLLGLLMVSGCAGMPGTNTGALVGGVAGAALSRDNPVAGALLGGVGGALLGNMIDNSGRQGYGYRGNRGHYNPGSSDRAYYERLERQRAFEQRRAYEQQRAYEEQMQWRRLQQQRQWEQQRNSGGGCYRC
ncbi:hypothetical protein BH11CYA1_BH11CYA1_35040 [soil metagenome]